MRAATERRRVLIVTAAMGGGHMQISKELRRRLVDRGHHVVLADMLELMPAPTGRWLGQLYPLLVNRAPRLYQKVYDVFFLADQRAGERAGVPVRLALPGLRRLVEECRPDVVVSTYHLSALAVGRLRERGELDATAVTMITEFAVKNLWLHPAADLELCFSADAAADAARRTGRRALVCGPVVRPGFRGPAVDRSRTRAHLGVEADSRVALVTTGSIGLAGSASAAAHAISGLDGWVPVVLCGRDEEMHEQMAALPGVVALQWVEDMPAVMSAADVLVDNAGGMSSKEALGIGLPVVTFRPLTGHGRADAEALEHLGLTDVVTDEHALQQTLQTLARDERRYRDRVTRGKALFVTDAADIVEGLAGGDVARAS